MAKKNRKFIGEAHVRLYRHELDCPAYRTLGPAARALLVELRALFDAKRGDNHVFLGVRGMMERCNLSQRAAVRARNELVERGWIAVVESGAFQRKVKHATVYALQNEPPNSGNGSTPSKAFMRWQPQEQKNSVCKSTTDRYANRLPRHEKTPVSVCKSTTEKAKFEHSSVCKSTTQISITKRRAA